MIRDLVSLARARRSVAMPLGLAGVLIVLTAAPAAAQSEDALKSAFIFNFARFTTWPASAFSGASAPLVVGFVGSPALADAFGKSVVGKNVNGHALEVKTFDGAASVDPSCHVVVVGGGQGKAVAGKVKGKPVLLVGQDAGFLEAGGMINLVVDGGKVGFEISPATAEGASLALDAKLKTLAKAVK
jgi:hypothetical protein